MPRCKEIFKKYKGTYARMFAFMDTQGHLALTIGVTTNLAGRKRFYRPTKWDDSTVFPHVDIPDDQMDAVRREGLNTPIQGLAADIMKLAMQLIHDEIIYRGWWKIWGPEGRIIGTTGPGACLNNQVHDEVSVRCDDAIAEDVREMVERLMLEAEARLIPSVVPSVSCRASAPR